MSKVDIASYMASADSGNTSMAERLGEQLQRLKKADSE